MARAELVLERAIDNAIRELERDPEVGQTARDAREYFILTKGKFTPWAEVRFADPIENLRSRHTGSDYTLFANIVEVLRQARLHQPERAI